MDIVGILRDAIRQRKPIEFEYSKPEKIKGKRIGNPHILFIHPATEKTEIHIFQTGGVSDSDLTNGLPWRLFIVDFMENVRILAEESIFEIAEGYNSDSPMYDNVIAKV